MNSSGSNWELDTFSRCTIQYDWLAMPAVYSSYFFFISFSIPFISLTQFSLRANGVRRVTETTHRKPKYVACVWVMCICLVVDRFHYHWIVLFTAQWVECAEHVQCVVCIRTEQIEMWIKNWNANIIPQLMMAFIHYHRNSTTTTKTAWCMAHATGSQPTGDCAQWHKF